MLRIALGVSLLLHTALGVWVEVRGAARELSKPVADSWHGPGIEVDAVTTESRPAVAGAGVALAPAPDTARADSDAPSVPRPRAVRRPSDDATRESRRAAPSREPHRREAGERPATRSSPAAKREGSSTNPETPPAGASSAPAAASPSGTDGASTASSGAFGAEGLPAGVRHLPKAFTRALGLASRGDPRWLTQAPGPVGEATIRLSVDEDGRLGELEYVTDDERSPLPPVVVHLLENTRLLLLAGRFSLDPAHTRAGTQTLRVRVEITEREADVDPDADPNGLNELEYAAPNGRTPGRGSFRLNSGRRVTGWVYVE